MTPPPVPKASPPPDSLLHCQYSSTVKFSDKIALVDGVDWAKQVADFISAPVLDLRTLNDTCAQRHNDLVDWLQKHPG